MAKNWEFVRSGVQMPSKNRWAVGVDLGGTKIIVARVDTLGILRRKLRLPTNASKGPTAVKSRSSPPCKNSSMRSIVRRWDWA